MVDKNNIPQHVAIIMDGNGRWAQSHGLSRSRGHREGIKRIKEIVDTARQAGIGVLTLFVFSTENWQRPKKEIDMLMRYLNNFLEQQIEELNKNNIRFKVIGRDEPLPKYLLAKIKEAESRTKHNTGLVVVVALNYGSRQEIVDAAKKFCENVLREKIRWEALDEEKFKDYLYTQGLPDPDLLIRTSGEMRLSNFLLWQLSYSEFYFSKKYWPDFRKEDFKTAIKEHQRRQRKFGRVN